MEGVYSDLAVSGADSIGGLVGLNLGGTINNAYSTGTVTTIAWGNEFQTAAGGFAGSNTGNIINAYSTGAVNGKTFVGGFVGYNDASGTIANVYSTGRVTGLESIGGLIGTNLGSAPISSYWNFETAGTSTSAGGKALNSSEMLQSAPFAFYDFTTVWRQYQGHTTPLLKSFMTPITATLRDTSKVYDGQGWSPLTVASLSDPAAANSAELFGTGSTSRNAGTYTVTPELWSSQRGYDIRVSGPSTVQAQITPKELVLIATAADKVYDDTRDSPASPTFEGLAAGDSLTSLRQIYDSPNAGPRTLSVNGYQLSDGNANKNYFVTRIAASSNITPLPLTLTAATDNKEYNGTTTSTGVVTAAGLISDDTVNATQAFDSANAGSRTLQVNTDYIISDGNGGGNYAVTRVETSGNIRKRPLVLAAADDSKIYDRSTASTGIVTAVNLVARDGLSATQAFDSADAGSRRLLVNSDYIINDGAGGANYDATTTFGRGTISPRPLTVTSVGLTKYLDGIPFSGGNGVTYNGFLTGDTPAVLGGRLAFGGSAQGAVGLGVFDIMPFGLTSGNYAISPASGKLVITVAPYVEALAIAQLPPGSLPPANAFLDGRAVSDAFMVDERDTAEDAERRLNLRIVDGGIRLPAGLK
ncbi:MAG: hypothetical protein JWQ23_4518 [Herminiimonas sp.]|nr:hypothetical protein [Herminiimonas sp.]